MSEIWKPVVGLTGQYEVSDQGRLRSLNREIVYSDGRVGHFRGRVLSSGRGAEGYLHASVARSRRVLVHRLVAEAFVDRPPGCDVVNHKNGDKRDNRAANLEWGTFATNNRHARDTGLLNQHGENCNLTRYSEHLVAAVRRVHERYKPSFRELAVLFDMSDMQAADIVKGRSRKRG